ncbi:MAG: hypothetical protein M3Y28_06865 [Armatimonadota bacterium]|nr:hypothetical protein [Armatimonadota bacterium]
MQIDEIEARNAQPTHSLNPEPDADPKTLDPNGAYGQSDDGNTGLDNQTDGDRQLTTDSDAIDTGNNDSDLGADAGFTDIHGLGPDVTGGQTNTDATGDGATGIGSGLRE